MTIQSAEAWAHGMHRKDSPQDIVIFAVIGVTLLVLLPARQTAPASAPISEPNFCRALEDPVCDRLLDSSYELITIIF
jgi:hypothetical protein